MDPNPAVLLIRPILPEPAELVDIAVSLGFAVLVGLFIQRTLFLVVGRVEKWITRAARSDIHSEQRARTIGAILRGLITVFIAGAVVIYVLAVMGWDVRPLLAGAGIVGVALGFGAQTLVRDVIAGIFIIAEDQFAVGDVIEVNGRAATVEALTVRSATLRDFNGHLHFVPNGEMKIVINRSRGWNRLAVDVPIAPGEDLDQVLEICARIAGEMSAEPAWKSRLLEPVQVWGVEALGAQNVQIRLVVRARPGGDAAEAARELRRRVHRALGEAGVRATLQTESPISPVSPSEIPPTELSAS